MKVYEDDLVAMAQSGECAIPGYLVLRVKTAGAALPDLDPGEAGRLGAALAGAARAIAAATAAERVYCLSFCEVDPRLHFHLFPRTRWLLDAYLEATGTGGQPVNGPALFEWARRRYPAGSALPPGIDDAAAVAARVSRLLAG
jgi:diadenosine tetraphosphate (Ap4A) HIT family hydrolase